MVSSRQSRYIREQMKKNKRRRQEQLKNSSSGFRTRVMRGSRRLLRRNRRPYGRRYRVTSPLSLLILVVLLLILAMINLFAQNDNVVLVFNLVFGSAMLIVTAWDIGGK